MPTKNKTSVRIAIRNAQKKFFGTGVFLLLKNIDETGSINAACEKMGMAYSKAWRMLKDASDGFGFDIITTQKGGADGGRTMLTFEGRLIVDRFAKIQSEISEITEREINLMWKEINEAK